MSSTLPPGWESDYDGSRWFFRYQPTGIIQYHFPQEGDEFPEFYDNFSPPPALAPEERLESQQQVKRRISTGCHHKGCSCRHDRTKKGHADHNGSDDDQDGDDSFLWRPESFMYLGPGSYHDVSPLGEDQEEVQARRAEKEDTSKGKTTSHVSPVSNYSKVSPITSAHTTPQVPSSDLATNPSEKNSPVNRFTSAAEDPQQSPGDKHVALQTESGQAQYESPSGMSADLVSWHILQDLGVPDVEDSVAPAEVPMLDSRELPHEMLYELPDISSPIGFIPELPSDSMSDRHQEVQPPSFELPANEDIYGGGGLQRTVVTGSLVELANTEIEGEPMGTGPQGLALNQINNEVEAGNHPAEHNTASLQESTSVQQEPEPEPVELAGKKYVPWRSINQPVDDAHKRSSLVAANVQVRESQENELSLRSGRRASDGQQASSRHDQPPSSPIPAVLRPPRPPAKIPLDATSDVSTTNPLQHIPSILKPAHRRDPAPSKQPEKALAQSRQALPYPSDTPRLSYLPVVDENHSIPSSLTPGSGAVPLPLRPSMPRTSTTPNVLLSKKESVFARGHAGTSSEGLSQQPRSPPSRQEGSNGPARDRARPQHPIQGKITSDRRRSEPLSSRKLESSIESEEEPFLTASFANAPQQPEPLRPRRTTEKQTSSSAGLRPSVASSNGLSQQALPYPALEKGYAQVISSEPVSIGNRGDIGALAEPQPTPEMKALQDQNSTPSVDFLPRPLNVKRASVSSMAPDSQQQAVQQSPQQTQGVSPPKFSRERRDGNARRRDINVSSTNAPEMKRISLSDVPTQEDTALSTVQLPYPTETSVSGASGSLPRQGGVPGQQPYPAIGSHPGPSHLQQTPRGPDPISLTPGPGVWRGALLQPGLPPYPENEVSVEKQPAPVGVAAAAQTFFQGLTYVQQQYAVQPAAVPLNDPSLVDWNPGVPPLTTAAGALWQNQEQQQVIVQPFPHVVSQVVPQHQPQQQQQEVAEGGWLSKLWKTPAPQTSLIRVGSGSRRLQKAPPTLPSQAPTSPLGSQPGRSYTAPGGWRQQQQQQQQQQQPEIGLDPFQQVAEPPPPMPAAQTIEKAGGGGGDGRNAYEIDYSGNDWGDDW